MQVKRNLRVFAPSILTGLLLSQGASLRGAEWNTAASACSVDEGSASKGQLSGPQFHFVVGQTGQIDARCNVANPMDLGGDPGWNTLHVTYRDPDTGAATANQILVSLKRVYLTGAVETIATFDSNAHSGAAAVQSKIKGFTHVFNYPYWAYFVEITVKRSPSALPGNDPGIYRIRLLKI